MRTANACLIFVVAVSRGLSQEGQVGISAEDAWRDIGKTETVCGQVVDTATSKESSDPPTYLYLGRPHPEQVFTVVIPDARRAMFAESPEKSLRGKRLCVRGMIERDGEGSRRAQVVLEDEEQIVVE